ncbi:Fic/DOC family protein [Symbioplanes lichenis]|uniref:Fic/DOC family protein n=1 Tax=Symbioplanes lichenis TaxID=1629072 RepID=UPI00273A3445|nr:Fic family protein [Actinoplanes lichenis]
MDDAASEDPYVDRHGVLVNKLGITSASVLSQAEADLSLVALLRLSVHPLPGRYDLDHLRQFHRQIFGVVYPWAGELRTVDLARTENDRFCRWTFLESYAAGVFGELAAERLLTGLPRSNFVARLAHFYGEINALHPFREGNGRTQRAFLGQLAREAGWRIAWSALDATENDQASAASLRGDEEPLLALLDDLVRPL